MSPPVGWTPTTPEYAAGRRVEPPPSEPIVNGSSAAAAEAAPPELDQPGTLLVSHGLRASTSQLNVRVGSDAVPSCPPDPIIVFIPTTIAPASRRRAMPKWSRVPVAF